MKSIIFHKAIVPVGLLAGVGLWVGHAKQFDSEGKLDYKPNVACIKGSPYGKVLALAMQGEIDLYWHKGSTHEYAETLNEDHHHDHGDGHHHHHGPGGHHHGHGHDHGDHHGQCDDDGHDHTANHDFETVEPEGAAQQDAVQVVAEVDKPLRQRAKKALKVMEATAHRRTDDKPLSPAHRKYIQESVEDMLRLAYEMDPSNYTNYGNYHLFIATTTFGRNAANADASVALARRTLDYCKKDNVDPASWVTAASAAYNIIYHIGRYHDQFTVTEAKASLAEFDYCVKRYHELLDVAIEEGRIVSEERYQEMLTRIKYLGKLRYAQGQYMKRMMSSKVASNAPTTNTQ